MSAASIKAGAAYVQLFVDNDPLVRGLKSASAELKAFGASVAAIGRQMLMGGLALAAPLGMAVKLAADATETTNKFLAVFGSEAAAATQFVNQFAASVGRSRVEAMNGLAAFQAMFVGLGYGPAQARNMSQEMQQLAVDFASFHNLSDAEATERFISALAGSSQVLDMFGISIREASLDEAFLALGMNVTTRTATEQQKVMARLHTIQTSMQRQGAVGDAIATAGSLSNQWKRLSGVFNEAATAIGSALAPAVNAIVGALSRGIATVGAFIRENSELVLLAGGLAAGLVTVGASLMALGGIMSVAGTALGLLTFPFTVLSVVMSAVGTVASIVAAVVGFLTMPFSLLAATMGSVAAVATAMWAAITGPIGLVIAAGAAIGGLVFMAGSSSGAFATLGQGISALGGIFSTTFQGIRDSIAAGDLQGAMEMAWLGLRSAWNVGIAYLSAGWREFTGSFEDGWDETTTNVGAVLYAAWAGVRNTFLTVVDVLANAWDSFCGGLQIAFNEFVAVFRRGWAYVRNMFDGDARAAAIEQINNETAAANQQVSSAVAANRARRAGEGAAREEQDTQVIQTMQGDLARRQQDRGREREAANAADLAPVAEIQAELQRRRDEAAWTRALAPGGGSGGGGAPQTPNLNGVGPERQRIDVTGSFGGANAGQLGASSVSNLMQQQTQLQSRTATAVERIAGNTENMGLGIS